MTPRSDYTLPDVAMVYYGRERTAMMNIVRGVSSCASCDGLILWVITPRGKPMPVDAEPDSAGRYTSHFATCPDADGWRRRRRAQGLNARTPGHARE